MSETRNLIVAATLSMLVLLAWQVFYVQPRQEEAKNNPDVSPESAAALESIRRAARGDDAAAFKDRSAAVAEGLSRSERVPVATEMLSGSISLKGARLDDLMLKGYRQSIAPDSADIALFSPGGTKEVYYAAFGWLAQGGGIRLPDGDSVWQAQRKTLSAGKPVTVSWDNGAGLLFTQTIAVDDQYMFSVTQSVENRTGAPVTLSPYGRISRAKAEEQPVYISHEGPLGVFNKILHEVPYDELKEEGEQTHAGAQGWIGMADKYWLAAIIPSQETPFDGRFSFHQHDGLHRYQSDFLAQPVTIQPGAKTAVTHHLFAGPKKIDLLDQYAANLNVPLFDRAIDFGHLYFLTRPLFWVLQHFYGWLGNFGLAILMLTVIVRAILFPLANQSYISMAKIRELAPEMQAMRDRYKDDRVKAQQEIMRFYKERKINPAAGCLPILVQIPIFFALYKVLFISIEMRQAPFYGWLRDLSAPDPTNIFNLFGLINWAPPSWMPALGVLPLLYGVTMFIHQHFSPQPTDPVQAAVFRWMPVLFTFVFASFPAGLVLYWTWSNILSIFQQQIITRRVRKNTAE